MTAKGSSADTQDKDPLLDKDMGKEFLSSWKSMSEDDPMDFNFDPPANNKKFNFEKLDMGFDLDGDFGKLSSFKVDMPDFDFSSPSKETATKKSSDNKHIGNSKQKKDLFSFSFDFNELDGFDLESSSRKKGNETSTETKDSDKAPSKRERKKDDFDALNFSSNLSTNGQTAAVGNIDVKVTASEINEKDISKTSDTVVIDNSLSAKQPESMESSVVESPQRPWNSKADKFCQELQSLRTSPIKKSCNIIEEIDEQSPSSETMVPLQSHTSETAQTPVKGKTGPDVQEVFRSGAKEDSLGSPDQNAHVETISTVGSSHQTIEPKMSSQLCTAVQDTTGHEQNELVTDTPVKIVDQTRTTLSDPDTGSIPTAISGKLSSDTCNSQNVQMQDPSTTILVAPSHRVVKLDDLKAAEKAGEGPIQSRFFKRPDQTESRDLQPSPNRLEFLPVNKERVGLMLHPANPRRVLKLDDLKAGEKAGEGPILSKVFKRPDQTEPQDLQPSPNRLEFLPINKERVGLMLQPVNPRSAKDAQLELKSRKNSKALHVVSPNADHANTDSEKKVENINADRDHLSADTVGNGTKLTDFSKLQVKSTTKERSIMQMSNKDSSPTAKTSELLTSGTESLHKPKVSSLERFKLGKIVSDVTMARTLRTTGAIKDSSDTTLHREVNSSTNKEQNTDAPRKKNSEIHHSFARDKTQVLQLSSLKRKALDEDRNVGALPLNPLKRFSIPPSESRNSDEISRRGGAGGKFCRMETTTKNLTRNSPNHGLETRQQINLAELEIPETENDDNVAKAEAYTKELENICNILRKKHEEAKELLVRAVVNNNNLLMLNHPLYEQKIRVVQKFAKELPMQSQTMVA